MDTRADDLNGEGDLPQPGTEEPKDAGDGDSVEGPGNVSVDEPTAPALEDDALDEGDSVEGSDEGGSPSEEDDDDDESSSDDG